MHVLLFLGSVTVISLGSSSSLSSSSSPSLFCNPSHVITSWLHYNLSLVYRTHRHLKRLDEDLFMRVTTTGTGTGTKQKPREATVTESHLNAAAHNYQAIYKIRPDEIESDVWERRERNEEEQKQGRLSVTKRVSIRAWNEDEDRRGHFEMIQLMSHHHPHTQTQIDLVTGMIPTTTEASPSSEESLLNPPVPHVDLAATVSVVLDQALNQFVLQVSDNIISITHKHEHKHKQHSSKQVSSDTAHR